MLQTLEELDGPRLMQLLPKRAMVVICGATGTGKTMVLKTLANACDMMQSLGTFEEQRHKAICSHQDLHGGDPKAGVKTLHRVALHAIPTHLKPAHVLSEGERARVDLAVAMQKGSLVQDDFLCTLDMQTASALCTGLSRYWRSEDNKGSGPALLATCKVGLVPFLQPDVVLHLLSDKKVMVHKNPNETLTLRPELHIATKVECYESGTGAGWRGPQASLDELPLQPLPLRSHERIRDAAVRQDFSTEVDLDDYTMEASKPLDYIFEGKITQQIFLLKQEILQSFPWRVGCILGPSGSGKSSNLKLFEGGLKHFEWSKTESVWQQLSCDDAKKTGILEVVTLNGSACYHQLSMGERSLADLARTLAEAGDILLVDEFTSHLDRQRAFKVSCNLRSFMDGPLMSGIRMVLAGCQADVVDWLCPEWSFRADSGELLRYNDFTRGPSPDSSAVSFQPPHLHLTLTRLPSCQSSRDVFDRIFACHHYMEGQLPFNLYGLLLRSSTGEVVAYSGVSTQPGQIHDATREARLVVLPSWQGFGIGPKLSAMVGGMMRASGQRFFAKTSNQALGGYRDKHPELWRPTITNGKPCKSSIGEGFKRKRRAKRAVEELNLGETPLAPADATFSLDCPGCIRAAGPARRGRPPKHTCGSGGAPRPLPLPNDGPVAPVGRKIRSCYAHEYIGPALPNPKRKKDDGDDLEVEQLVTKIMKMTEIDI